MAHGCRRKVEELQSRKPQRPTPIRKGRAYRRRRSAASHLGRVMKAAPYIAVGLAVFGAGMVAVRRAPPPVAVSAQAGPGAPPAGHCYFLSVHDGDTIRCGSERIRIENIDAPELEGSPKCEDYRSARAWCDYALGERSRDALGSFLDSGTIGVRRSGKDKYGRTLARIEVNGQDAGEYLVGQGLARRWD